MPSPRGGSRHEWDRNKPEKGRATCVRCGMVVKEYKIHRGGLMTCEEYMARRQSTLEEHDEKAVCMTTKLRPVISCFYCPGKLSAKKCEELRYRCGYRPSRLRSYVETLEEIPQPVPA